MAWNGEKKRWECDRCGKPIYSGNTLCKECNEWLEDWCREKESQNADIQVGSERGNEQ